MSLDSSFILILIFISLGSIQASLENLILFWKLPAIANYRLDKGILKSSLANKFKLFYNSPGIWFLAILRLCSGFFVLFSSILGEVHFLPVLFLLITDVMGFSRWKYLPSSEIPMQRVILIAILVHAYFDSTSLSEILLHFISAFLCLAYLASGFKKMTDKHWQDGTTITSFLTNGATSNVKWRWLGFMVIFFECGFIIGIVSIKLATLFIVIGFLFHLYLYLKHQLNFFFWTFVAAYPAFYYTTQKLSPTIIEWLTL